MDKYKSWEYEEKARPTGRVYKGWKEYSEKPRGHGIGYFWMRDDGLRFGWRQAGNYYKPGTTAGKEPRAIGGFEIAEHLPNVTGGPISDGAKIFDVAGDIRESAKREWLPMHLRVMKDGEELELIIEIDGDRIAFLYEDKNFDEFSFMDKRYPPPPPPKERMKSVKTGERYKPD